jgi:hypothetical protein
MRRLLLLIGFICIGIGAQSQQYHYVYLQTDNKQSFYVRIEEKLYSSSSTGYLVIPKLRSGNYIITVGFPKNEWPAQRIPLQINNKDLGYALKNFGNKGWGLYNWQTLEVINSNFVAATTTVTNSTKVTDGFSSTLSEVVNTTLQKKPVEQPVPTPLPPNNTKETDGKPISPQGSLIITKGETKISKILSTTNPEGTTLIYVDKWEGGVDTVRILLMPELISLDQEIKRPNSAETNRNIQPDTPVKAPQSSEKFLNMELPNPNTGDSSPIASKIVAISLPQDVTPEINTSPKSVMINSDCKQVATEADFFKSRKKMVAQESEQAMNEAAVKLFKQKCYTVAQIKNLSALFLTDLGKFNFFESAYPFVLDSHNFSNLEKVFTDSFYINRFKVLVNQ